MKRIYTILAAVFLTTIGFSQTPEKMSYQAVVRDSDDKLLANQAIGMQISILQTSASGTAIYIETQNPTTNINGLVSLEIGTGSVVSGDFTTIDWSADTYFIKTETDPTGGSSYTITGTSQLMSVPYALYAKTSGSSTPGPTGPQGAQGIPGADGADGTNGADGATGAQGLQGIAGNDGADGTNGATGATGPQGLTGNDGINGADGAQGIQGPAGNDGATGPQGLTGNDGTNGTNGVDGAQGIQGIAGNDGADGATGAQGIPGNDGADGIGIAQTLSFTSPNITLSDSGGTIDLTQLINDADSDISNEIQNISEVLTDGNDAGGAGIVNLGDVSIGTITTSAKLDVIGNTELNGTITIIDGTQAAGKVLSSDADGKASWVTPTSFPTGGTEGQVLTLNSSGVPVWADPYTGETFYEDTDGDGYGDINSTFVAFSAPNGYVSNSTDCNDNDATVFDANEVWYLDADNDNYAVSTVIQCDSPGIGYTTTVMPLSDCNDNDATVFDANEVWYLDADNDGYAVSTATQCDSPGVGYTTTVMPLGDCNDNDATVFDANEIWYLDADNDGYAVSTATQCDSPGVGYTTTVMPLGDCNDNDASINPDTIWYLDADSDNYGDINTSEIGCTPTLTNATQDNTDCNDSDANINPDTVWYLDADSDNYAASMVTQCATPGTGYTTTVIPLGDCNDSDASINPEATEVFDSIDNNCDGIIDIGAFYKGGIVFWVDPIDGSHGLVCAIQDQSTGIQWYNGSNITTGASGIAIGSGTTNTDAIIVAQGAVETNYAAGLARAYTGGGFSDWFLPSKDELNEMYQNKAAINNTATSNGGTVFSASAYWSSTETDIYGGQIQLFSNGAQGNGGKHSVTSMRAVRAF